MTCLFKTSFRKLAFLAHDDRRVVVPGTWRWWLLPKHTEEHARMQMDKWDISEALSWIFGSPQGTDVFGVLISLVNAGSQKEDWLLVGLWWMSSRDNPKPPPQLTVNLSSDLLHLCACSCMSFMATVCWSQNMYCKLDHSVRIYSRQQ